MQRPSRGCISLRNTVMCFGSFFRFKIDFVKIWGEKQKYKEKNTVVQFIGFFKNSIRRHYVYNLPVCQEITFFSSQMKRPDSKAPGRVALDIICPLLQCT